MQPPLQAVGHHYRGASQLDEVRLRKPVYLRNRGSQYLTNMRKVIFCCAQRRKPTACCAAGVGSGDSQPGHNSGVSRCDRWLSFYLVQSA